MERICLIIHSLGIGGMERVMHQLCLDFAGRQDLEVHLVLIGIKREVVYEMPDSVTIHKPGFEFNNVRRSWDTFRTMRFLRNEVKEIDPDVILSFGEFWNNLVLLSLTGLSYPVYISDRSEPGKDLGRVQNFLRDRLYPKATGYIAQTKEAGDVCSNRGWNDNIRVIGNPIREIDCKGPEKRDNIVLSVGRLIKTKHFDRLIRIFAEIDAPGWKLLIVGGDAKKQSLSQDLNKLIQELGVEGRVFLEGEQREIDSYYCKSKIFAFTSSSEGFPNVIGEALSAGLPVVSYDCVAGPADMISDGENGFLVPLFNDDLFRDRLKSLMHDETMRNRLFRATEKSVSEFSVREISDKFHNFIVFNHA